MIDLTPEAQHLIARGDLGRTVAVYKPNTIGSIIASLIFIALGAVILWVDVSVTNASLFLQYQSSFRVLSLSPSFSPGLTDTFLPDPSFGIIFTIFGIVFFLIGLFFVLLSLRGGLNAILNRHAQAVICANGVAFVMHKSAGTFRWEQVLNTFNKVSVNTSTSSNRHGAMRSNIIIHNTYTVYCQDGRKFVFDSSLGKVEDLAEEIEARIARWRTAN